MQLKRAKSGLLYTSTLGAARFDQRIAHSHRGIISRRGLEQYGLIAEAEGEGDGDEGAEGPSERGTQPDGRGEQPGGHGDQPPTGSALGQSTTAGALAAALEAAPAATASAGAGQPAAPPAVPELRLPAKDPEPPTQPSA